MLCCVNPRLYNYCPECGKYVYPQIKQWIIGECPNAMLKYNLKIDIVYTVET